MNSLTFLSLSPAHIIMLILIVIPYFVPTIIAFNRKKTNTGAIFALNLFLGWSLIGWVIALIWALSNIEAPQQIVISSKQNSESNIDQLLKLKDLHEKGALTDEEFKIQKDKLLK